ncbi:MAG: tRNA-dihydrouridine synthase family protein, partial [Lachnospiraceae bacterium]|nr:tRNA-dihydrouridine synthase family protein [Lachnospiraceae bacterium]
QIDKYFTPFIPAAKRLSRKILRDIDPANNEGIRLVPQLISNRSDEILDMIRQLKDRGFSEFNINLGCPSGTVVSKKRGSGMLLYPQELDRFLDGIYSCADVPVSVKTRIGFYSVDEWPTLLAIYRRYPMSEFIIHPRVRAEMYTGFPHLEAFQAAYEVFAENDTDAANAASKASIAPAARLCYNGDIWDTACYAEVMKHFPKLSAVMIGRGLLARPDLACCIKGVPVQDTREKIRAFCDEIYDGYLSIFSGEKDVFMHMKEIWANLGKSFQDSDRLVRKLMKSQSPSEYRYLMDQIFDTLELSPR